MNVDFEGRTWTLDTAHVMLRQALEIQRYTGMSIADWEESVTFKRDDQGNLLNPPPEWLKSVGALYWLMRSQSGDVISIDDVDVDFTAFMGAFYEALARLVERRAQAQREQVPVVPTSPVADGALPSPETSAYPTAMTPAPLPQPAVPIAYSPPPTWPG